MYLVTISNGLVVVLRFCDIHKSFKVYYNMVKGKAIPLQAWIGPQSFGRFRLPEFLDHWHMKVAKLSALHTSCLCPLEIFLVLISLRG
jgi:hypothetical protein